MTAPPPAAAPGPSRPAATPADQPVAAPRPARTARHAGPAGADAGAVLRAPRAAAAPQGAVLPPPAAAQHLAEPAPASRPVPGTAAVDAQPAPAALPPMPYGARRAAAWEGTAHQVGSPQAGDLLTTVTQDTGTGLAAGAADTAAAVVAEEAAAPQAEAAAAPQGAAVAALDNAVAAPDGDVPTRPRPTRPVRRRRPWTVGGLHVLQLVVWEAAVAAVLTVHRQSPAVLVPVAVVATLAVLLTAVRVRGRWLHQWLGLWLRFRARRRSVALGGPGDTTADVARTVLDSLARGSSLGLLRVGDDEVGTIVHTTGLSVLVETSPEGGDPTAEATRTLPPLTALLPPVEDDDATVPALAVQLLVQTVPAPAWAGADDPAALSYRQLTGGTVPARRRCWVALQVVRRPDDDGTADLEAPLVNGLRRLRRQLERAGLRTQVLGPDDLAAALIGVAGLEAGPQGLPRGGDAALTGARVTETWTGWSAGTVVHTTFRLLDWPSLESPAGQELVDRLGTSTAVSTTVSLAARRVSADQVELATSLRVVLPGSAALDDVTARLQAEATSCGARVERLDGRQAAGMAAAVAFGGFLR